MPRVIAEHGPAMIALRPMHAVLLPERFAPRERIASWLPEAGRIDFGRAASDDVDAVVLRSGAPVPAGGKPAIWLGNGLLRSIAGDAPPLSMTIDDVGDPNDGQAPSRLEQLLQTTDFDASLVARAEAAIAAIVTSRLSPISAAPPRTPHGDGKVLIAGSAEQIAGLRRRLRNERGEADVVAASPSRDGWLVEGEAVRSADLLASVDAVWVEDAAIGFEALIRGLPVRCTGMPFYAGWGATRDDAPCPRRSRRRSAAEIFAAAYILAARYADPLRGEATTIEATIARLIAWRTRADADAGPIHAARFTPWKRAATRAMLAGPRTALRFAATTAEAIAAAKRDGGRVLVWAGKEDAATTARLAEAAVPVVRMEDGFLRSRGLGSDFHLPASVVLDDQGIYFDPQTPSRLETILGQAEMAPPLLARAAALRERLVTLGLSKYNVGRAPRFADSGGRFRLLCVGQVEDDRSIARGTSDIATNAALLAAARAAHPAAWILYKPHPDVESGNRRGAIPARTTATLADEIAAGADIAQCLAAADGLATMTSLAGFEALLRGLPVWTFGGPFYAGWGLTQDRDVFPRRRRRLTIDMLVAGALLLYPRYVHPPTGLPCTAEELVAWLATAPSAPPGPRWRRALRATLAPLRAAKF